MNAGLVAITNAAAGPAKEVYDMTLHLAFDHARSVTKQLGEPMTIWVHEGRYVVSRADANTEEVKAIFCRGLEHIGFVATCTPDDNMKSGVIWSLPAPP